MKKKTIKHLGIKYSAYSDRAVSLRKHQRRHKRETTVKAVSFLLATGLTVLHSQAMV